MMFFRDLQFSRRVPSGAVEQENGVGTGCDVAGDFPEMGLHGLCVGPGQDERGTGASRRTDSAEEVEALIALVLGLTGSAAAARPLADQGVLLAQTHLVLPPQLDRRCGRQVAYGRCERAWEVFLKSSSTPAFWAG